MNCFVLIPDVDFYCVGFYSNKNKKSVLLLKCFDFMAFDEQSRKGVDFKNLYYYYYDGLTKLSQSKGQSDLGVAGSNPLCTHNSELQPECICKHTSA